MSWYKACRTIKLSKCKKTIVCDIFEYEKLNIYLNELLPKDHLFDVITSDIAPNTTWIFDVDQYVSIELNIAICKFSDKYLKMMKYDFKSF